MTTDVKAIVWYSFRSFTVEHLGKGTIMEDFNQVGTDVSDREGSYTKVPYCLTTRTGIGLKRWASHQEVSLVLMGMLKSSKGAYSRTCWVHLSMRGPCISDVIAHDAFDGHCCRSLAVSVDHQGSTNSWAYMNLALATPAVFSCLLRRLLVPVLNTASLALSRAFNSPFSQGLWFG